MDYIFTKQLNDFLFDYINSNTEELIIHEKDGEYYWTFRCVDSEEEVEGFTNPLDALLDFLGVQKETMDSLFAWHPSNKDSTKIKGS